MSEPLHDPLPEYPSAGPLVTNNQQPPADDFVVAEPDQLRSAIRDANDIGAELVAMPKWGVDVEVRSMTGAERAKYMNSMSVKGGERIDWKALTPSLLIASCWAPAKRASNGEWAPGVSQRKLFKPGDEDLINRKSADQLERLARVAQRLSGLGGADEDADETADDA